MSDMVRRTEDYMSEWARIEHEADRLRSVRDALRKANPHEEAIEYYHRAMTQLQSAINNLDRCRHWESIFEMKTDKPTTAT